MTTRSEGHSMRNGFGRIRHWAWMFVTACVIAMTGGGTTTAMAAGLPRHTALGELNGVVNYSNGPDVTYFANDRSYVNGVDVGSKWQCAEYVNRFYYLTFGLRLRSMFPASSGQTASDYFPNAAALGLQQYANGQAAAPITGDILCMGGGKYGAGHVAIVRSVSNDKVVVIQQNVKRTAEDAEYAFTMSVNKGKYFVDVSRLGNTYFCQGWLRMPGAEVSAAITSPAPGSKLAGSTVTFQWSAGAGALEYFLTVGSSYRGGNHYSGSQGLTVTSPSIGVPTDGNVVHVTLYTRFSDGWHPLDYTYTAARPVTAVKAAITSPTPGSRLAGSTVTFKWTEGKGVAQYFLYVGSSAGAHDIFGNSVSGTSVSVGWIPTDGRRIYVRIWSYINGAWVGSDATYTAARAVTAVKSTITSPSSGSKLKGSSETFKWSTGTGVEHYFLYVGSSVGANDIYGNAVSGTSQRVSRIPTDGRRIYVRIWSYINGTWAWSDETYTAKR